MVKLTVTAAAAAAVEEYCLLTQQDVDVAEADEQQRLSALHIGDPIDHHDLIKISQFLVRHCKDGEGDSLARRWRLENLLKGANVHQPAPPPKPEPSSQYKALMERLRKEEEQRQYERMINPPPPMETFSQRFPNAGIPIGSDRVGSIGIAADDVDDVTYADVNRQMTLIINVLVSVICCSIAIWIAARRWDAPQRLGLSMSGSGLIAVAEVAIYMGYIRRIKEAKGKEVNAVEKKKVVETWVLDRSSKDAASFANDSMRFRKGKHR